MPKKEMDYSKCIIYKIQHKDNNDLLYVGHTTNFTKRKNEHKSRVICEMNKEYNHKVYQMIRENGGWDDFNMVVIKDFPCENKQQATTEEDRIMREMKATMNTFRASRSQKEYRQDNKEYFINYKAEYFQKNKERITSKNNKVCICECGKEYTYQNRLRHEKTKFHKTFLNPCINIDPPSSSQPEPASSLVSRP